MIHLNNKFVQKIDHAAKQKRTALTTPTSSNRRMVPQDANPETRPPAPPPLGRRPQAWWLHHDARGLKFLRPSATGPCLGNSEEPRTEGYSRPVPTWSWQTPGQESHPTPPAKGVGDDRAATRLYSWDACIPGPLRILT